MRYSSHNYPHLYVDQCSNYSSHPKRSSSEGHCTNRQVSNLQTVHFVRKNRTNITVPGPSIFHSWSTHVFVYVAAVLSRGYMPNPPNYLAVIITVIGWISRERTETTLTHKRRLEREYSPCSEGGDDNKYLYELEHGCFTVSSVKCH